MKFCFRWIEQKMLLKNVSVMTLIDIHVVLCLFPATPELIKHTQTDHNFCAFFYSLFFLFILRINFTLLQALSKQYLCNLLKIFSTFFLTGADDVLKFQGNESAIDHFRLILRSGDSLLVGGR